MEGKFLGWLGDEGGTKDTAVGVGHEGKQMFLLAMESPNNLRSLS